VTSGMRMFSPDRGVEVGFESPQWSAQLAVSNGTGNTSAGGAETDQGKQVTMRAEHVRSSWRAGAGYTFNDADTGDRQAATIFGGLRTGPIAWLAEGDYAKEDHPDAADRKRWAGLLEANWGFRPGHNLKLTAEYLEPNEDVNDDEVSRYKIGRAH